MKETQFRNKIYWFTFLFSVLVVWTHSYNSELFLGRMPAAITVYRIEHFLGDTVAQIAVPGFFMISAYLFYRNFTWQKLSDKWNSRIKSVLLPFALWNAIYYLGYVIASRLPWVSDVLGKGVIPLDLFTAADAILHYTYNYVFWYLYQLLLLILLAPLLYGVLQHRYVGAIGLIGIALAIALGFHIPQLNLDALFYYAVAAYAALHGKSAVERVWNKKTGQKGLLLFVVSILLWYFCPIKTAGITVAFRLMVPIALWVMIPEDRLMEAKPWMRYNFFLYATHFAMVRLINKTAAIVLPGSPLLALGIYLSMPIMVTVISFWLGAFLRRYMPQAWRLLDGDRS
ncbi:MAG: acyltransferase family protein [Hungatella sp.]